MRLAKIRMLYNSPDSYLDNVIQISAVFKYKIETNNIRGVLKELPTYKHSRFLMYTSASRSSEALMLLI